MSTANRLIVDCLVNRFLTGIGAALVFAVGSAFAAGRFIGLGLALLFAMDAASAAVEAARCEAVSPRTGRRRTLTAIRNLGQAAGATGNNALRIWENGDGRSHITNCWFQTAMTTICYIYLRN